MASEETSCAAGAPLRMKKDRIEAATSASIQSESEFVPRQIAYCNVRRSDQHSVNGMLFVVSPTDLEQFDERERPYNRVEITEQLRAQGVEVVGGPAYMYVGKDEYRIDPYTMSAAEVGLRQSYLDIMKEGLDHLNSKFVQDFVQTTVQVPSHILFYDAKRGAGQGSLTRQDLAR